MGHNRAEEAQRFKYLAQLTQMLSSIYFAPSAEVSLHNLLEDLAPYLVSTKQAPSPANPLLSVGC